MAITSVLAVFAVQNWVTVNVHFATWTLQTLGALIVGALTVVAKSFALGMIHRDIPLTNEILVRTAPNLTDLAIATALVPPMCAASILLARGEVGLASGAYLLVFTNMVAIQFAASVVLWGTGFRRILHVAGLGVVGFLARNLMSFAIPATLAVVLAANLNRVVAQQVFETSVRTVVRREVESAPGNRVAQILFDRGAGTREVVIRAVVRGPDEPTPHDVAAWVSSPR